MRIALYTQGAAFHGHTLKERPLGGSESASLYIARSLAQRGHDVTVFNNCPRPGSYDGVRYRTHREIVATSCLHPYDVCIFSRFYDTAAAVKSRRKVLWLHDVAGIQYYSSLPEFHRIIDRYFFIGQWQKEGFIKAYSIPVHKVYVTRNGVDLTLFEQSVKREPNKLIYINTPFRGLDVLLEMFPAIRKQRLDSELFLFTGMSLYGEGFSEWDREMAALYDLARTLPGVCLQEPVAKALLATELLSARLALYPSHFGECCSIASLETQAAGTPMVTSGLAGLKDTIIGGRTGILIDVDDATLLSRSPTYKKKFIAETIALLDDDRRWEMLSRNGREHVRSRYSWETIAAEWESEFMALLGNARPGVGL
jgi:glycosyltransferase involved in cell wall biosynthesis